jgi:hypothetical protein
MGVRISQRGFRSKLAAEFAGQRALAGFLRALSHEIPKNRGNVFQAGPTLATG